MTTAAATRRSAAALRGSTPRRTTGAVAMTLRKPYVVQVWGTDVELARRVPWLARPILRRARLVIAASSFLAEQARALGAREVRVVASGVRIPESVGPPGEPPH